MHYDCFYLLVLVALVFLGVPLGFRRRRWWGGTGYGGGPYYNSWGYGRRRWWGGYRRW
ncbi:MAG TPA: hypothetical protein VI643_07995 [Planctomycetota bacterium]|nr:hypothetical protein [Planctomycetota bacterium]